MKRKAQTPEDHQQLTLGQSVAETVERTLQQLPMQELARQSGFEQRTPRKLAPLALVQAACQIALLRNVALRHWAILIGLVTRVVISKQAVKKRLTSSAVKFMCLVLQSLLQHLFRPPRPLESQV